LVWGIKQLGRNALTLRLLDLIIVFLPKHEGEWKVTERSLLSLELFNAGIINSNSDRARTFMPPYITYLSANASLYTT
jgi:hypothetical protein